MRIGIALVSIAPIAICSASARAAPDSASATPVAARLAAPDVAYVEVGMWWGSEHWTGGTTWSETALALATGRRISRLPIWARATAVIGDATTPAASENSIYELRAGLETRGCIVRYVCASAGVDVALHAESLTQPDEGGWGTHADWQQYGSIVPRVGLAIGNQVQLRPSVELARGFTDETSTLAISATAAYRW